jgi:hypothetical protein
LRRFSGLAFVGWEGIVDYTLGWVAEHAVRLASCRPVGQGTDRDESREDGPDASQSVLAHGLFPAPLHAQIVFPLLLVEVLYSVAQHRARHGGGVPVQEAQEPLAISLADLAQPPPVALWIRSWSSPSSTSAISNVSDRSPCLTK